MSENKFTPGPWQALFPEKSNGYWYVVNGSGFQIATVYESMPKNTIANVKLIAAAPELLQALIEAREMLITKGMNEDSVGLIGINNVIKKATE